MRNKLFIIIMAFLAIGLSGCTYVTNPPAECYYHVATYNLDTSRNPWGFDKKTQQFFARFMVPGITEAVYNTGNWSVSREYDADKKSAYQVTLPQTEYLVIEYEDPDSGETGHYYYSRHIDYRVGIGYVEIQLTYSDYIYEEDDKGNIIAPEDMLFRLQLIY